MKIFIHEFLSTIMVQLFLVFVSIELTSSVYVFESRDWTSISGRMTVLLR